VGRRVVILAVKIDEPELERQWFILPAALPISKLQFRRKKLFCAGSPDECI
jgi:hypothetical protein